jgi:hypothetical protein
MNIRASIRTFIDNLRGRFISRTVFDARRLTLASVTVEYVASALSQCQAGYMRQLADIYDMVPATDPHILGVRRQLRAGVQGLETEPVAVSDDPKAKLMADACKVAMERPGASWTVLPAGILEGYLRGASLTEVMWEDLKKDAQGKDILPSPTSPHYWKGFSIVPQQRLRYDQNTGELLLITNPALPNDAPPVSTFPPGKFVRCQVDEDLPDFSLRGTWRAVLSDWMGRMNVSRWEQFAIERYGMPIPVGKYATQDGKDALVETMQDFGAAGMLIVDQNSSIEWGSSTTKDLIHETYLEKSAERISVALLGASQTATIGKQAGSLASARVHEGIRRDILFAIAELVAECIRRDLFIPFIRENFGEEYVQYTPILKAQFDEPLDLKTTAEAWAVLSPMLAIPESYARDLTGIPAPTMGADGELESTLSAPAKPSLPPGALAPVAQFPAPKAVAAAAVVKVHVPETPPAFGQDVFTPYKKLVDSATSTADLQSKLKHAPIPTFDKSADLLAAEMFKQTMEAMQKARNARGNT